MPDVPLPPAGELVQITTNTDEKIIGTLRNGLFYAANGEGCWSPQYIASWCSVLVLPDTEETRQLIAPALTRLADLPLDSMTATVMAAVRGAAIR